MNTLSLSKNLVCQYQLRNSYLSLPCALPSLFPIPSSLGHFTATIYFIRPSRGTLSSTRSSHHLLQRNLKQFAASASMDSIAVSEQSGSDVNETVQQTDTIVQYIVLRKDLVETMKWPLGSVVSQGCHAAVAAIWLHKDDSVTAQYCGPENLDFMHKVTLEVKGETQLRNLAQKLENAGVAHKLWMEQPENVPTCLATKPYPKSEVATFFKSLKLCK